MKGIGKGGWGIVSKKILHLVIKNTSSLDFVLPFFWKLRKKHPEYELSVLYCTFDKRSILRTSSFYSKIFSEIGVEEYDFLDFIRPSMQFLKRLFRGVFKGSYTDKRSFFEIKENLKNGRFGVIGDLLLLAYYRLLYSFAQKFIDFTAIMPFFDADIILLDNRAKSNFPGRDAIFGYMYKAKRKVVLIPHAPHYRDPVSEFCPFDEKGEAFPSFCEHWIPMKYGEPWKAIGLDRPDNRFVYSGYPGFDKEWLNFCKSRIKKRDNTRRILFIIRRFLDKGIKRTDDVDYYILDFDDFYKPLLVIKEVMQELGDVELIIKAHPSNNYRKLVDVVKQSGIKNWTITYEPIYALLGLVDVVVSLPSTILLVPAMAGIPTILIMNKLQFRINERWSVLWDLYSNMNYKVDTISNLPGILKEALTFKDKQTKDIEHIGSFYHNKTNAMIYDSL